MVFAVFVAMTLAADPGAEKVFNVAAPGLSAAETDASKADFLNDYLAEQLSNEGRGRIRVITANEISAVLGNERQRQLLGCSDKSSSCIAELAGALGSDAVIVGSVARFGASYAMTVKVISANDASTLASTSVRDLKEDQLPGWIARAARELAQKLAPAAAGNAVVAASTTDPASNAPELPLPETKPVAEYKNAIWLSLTSWEYDRRLNGNSWLGVRFTPFAFSFSALEPILYGQLTAIARHHPIAPGQGFNYSLYFGLGVANGHTARASGWGGTALLGGELGYRWFRVSLEVNAFKFGAEQIDWGATPGLSVAIPF